MQLEAGRRRAEARRLSPRPFGATAPTLDLKLERPRRSGSEIDKAERRNFQRIGDFHASDSKRVARPCARFAD